MEPESNWRKKLYIIIFEAETNEGKIFDITLIIFVLLSILAVMLESVERIQREYYDLLIFAEWTFTVFFTIEYIARIICVHNPRKYIFSFFGLVDFFAILPTFLSLFLPGAQSLLAIRSLRLLRVFRVFKLTRYSSASNILATAIRQSRPKIVVFLFSVLTMVVVVGSIMYLVEGRENGFTSIPKSIYWAIVTMTTVGYGDIFPQTPWGQFISAILMIAGYGIIAVPTGIVTSELSFVKNTHRKKILTRTCRACTKEVHDRDANFCSSCGHTLEE